MFSGTLPQKIWTPSQNTRVILCGKVLKEVKHDVGVGGEHMQDPPAILAVCTHLPYTMERINLVVLKKQNSVSTPHIYKVTHILEL